MSKKDILYDKIKGALYGVAIGDALGAPLEFMTEEEIYMEHGGTVCEMIGGGWLNLKPGETTDDTAMTLAVARGIVASPKDPIYLIGENFKTWVRTGTEIIGKACKVAINNAIDMGTLTEKDWMLCSRMANIQLEGMTEGNGALMRTVYVGLYYHDLAERTKHSMSIAKMTHWAPVAADTCRIYSNLIAFELQENGFIKLYSGVTPLVGNEETEPNGHTLNTLICALQAVDRSATFEETLIEAVNRGGDADTIGAVAGGLAGAAYGFGNIPTRWIEALDEDLRDELDRLALAAYTTRVGSRKWD